MTTDGRPSWHHDDMLTVTDAARIAQRSARTIRRAYLSGRLVAHRDGNGRGIRIHYGDLRAWMLAELVAPRSEPTSSELMARVDLKGSRSSRQNTGNLELLSAVRRRRSRRARASATAQPPRGSAGSGNA